MSRRLSGWSVTALLVTLINVAGGAYAAWLGEMMHAALHGAVAIATVSFWRWWTQRRAAAAPSALDSAGARLDYLQQSVDAVAIEVERLGEAQRYAEKQRVNKP
ncbi:MAG: hypothetical protein K2X99_00550 [Gemmatimonadaceae bacterium]|nr:hypothetical protein [Gemmatimonadaceae bacterium]